jgi:hypothetical protein
MAAMETKFKHLRTLEPLPLKPGAKEDDEVQYKITKSEGEVGAVQEMVGDLRAYSQTPAMLARFDRAAEALKSQGLGRAS